MYEDASDTVKPRASPDVDGAVPDLSGNWLELEFYTRTQALKGHISCPAGMRILDMLNTPSNPIQNGKTEFMELKDYLKTDDDSGEPKTVCINKDDILFVSAPDADIGRGLGAKGEFKVYPFVPKTIMRVSIIVHSYMISGNLFRAINQTMIDVLNDGMFFLPLTEAVIGKDCHYSGDRPFVAVNKKQIGECREEYLSKPLESHGEVKTLSGLIPICAWCKKIRDDKGNWQIVEHRFKEQHTAEFTHSICPDCAIKYFPT
jgi:hypothetical protein